MDSNKKLIVTFICCFVIAGVLAIKLNRVQHQVSPTRKLVDNLPVAGSQKLLADIQWMQFIQYIGRQKTLDKSSAANVEKRLNNIIDLDPDFAKVYYDGALVLMNDNPDGALKVLEKGMLHPIIGRNWRLYMLAGHILIQGERANRHAHLPINYNRVKRAALYFKKAMNCADSQNYVVNQWLQAEAFNASETASHLTQLQTMLRLYKKHLTDMQDNENEMSTGIFGKYDTQEFIDKMISEALELRQESENQKGLKALLDEVVLTVFPNQEIDPYTLRPYPAGFRFSPQTGKPLKVHGVCKHCGRVLKGPFCWYDGTDNVAEWNKSKH